MLKKENTIYDWPDYYDWTSTGLDDDVLYYKNLVLENKGPVLELGCGTGRCAVQIAKEKLSVVGVDKSPHMLEVAKKKAKQMGLAGYMEWVESDMTTFHVPKRTFPIIISPYRSFQHLLTVADQLRTLRQVRNHLRDGGVFAFNIVSPNIEQLVSLHGQYQHRGTFPIPGTHDTVDVYDYTELNSFSQLVHVQRYYERFDQHGKMLERIKTVFTIRYTFPAELQHLLAVYGFRIRSIYGGFDQSPYDANSEEMIVEAIKVTK